MGAGERGRDRAGGGVRSTRGVATGAARRGRQAVMDALGWEWDGGVDGAVCVCVRVRACVSKYM